MQCRYCQAWNDEEERRCVRCGRRVQAVSARSVSESYPTIVSSTAPNIERIALPESSAEAEPHTEPRAESVSYQRSLFREPSLSDASWGPKVIPIPTLTPSRASVRAGEGRTVRHDPASSRRHRPPSARGARGGSDSQQMLDFHGAAHSSSSQSFREEVEIYCDAPVALPMHRGVAAAVDTSMVLVALGIFVAVFCLFGGDIVLNKQNAPFLLVVVFGIVFLYRSLWYMAGGDTPGMAFAGLRLVNFDGRAPNREQRWLRQAAGVLSLLSAGLGLMWALVDEESLTWHDHISKTFPTAGP